MTAKGTAGALALFRKFVGKDDHAKFMAVVKSMSMQAMCDGLARNADGGYMLDACGVPIYDEDKLHPHCKAAQQFFIEHIIGKAVQPVDVAGGRGGVRLLFTAADVAAFGNVSVTVPGTDEYGDETAVTVLAEGDA